MPSMLFPSSWYTKILNNPVFLRQRISPRTALGSIALVLMLASGAVLFFGDGRGATQLDAPPAPSGSAQGPEKSKGPEGAVSEETKHQHKTVKPQSKGKTLPAEPIKPDIVKPGASPSSLLPDFQNFWLTHVFRQLGLSIIPSAEAVCSYTTGYCSDSFLRKYFGDHTPATQKIVSQESSCNPAMVNGVHIGLFQLDYNFHCIARGEAPDATSCIELLKIPEQNARIAAQVRSEKNGWCPTWSAGSYCGACNDTGTLASVASPNLPLPIATPPSQQPGGIQGKKLSDVFPQGIAQSVWLDCGAPKTSSNPFNFTSIAAGVHTIRVGVFYFN